MCVLLDMWLCVHVHSPVLLLLVTHMFLRLHRFSQFHSHLNRLLTVESQRGKGLSGILIKRQPRHKLQDCSKGTLSLLPLSDNTLLPRSHLILLLSALLFFFPVLSSAFCFNSHLITSHVPHKVLISSLPLESARLTGTHAQIHTRMHVHTPHHRFLCVPHWCVTCTCIFNACAPWLHFII